jgi:hypothetical protein
MAATALVRRLELRDRIEEKILLEPIDRLFDGYSLTFVGLTRVIDLGGAKRARKRERAKNERRICGAFSGATA